MRKLGMDRLHDIERMTFTEFCYKKYAQEYKELDDQHRLHMLAFLIRNAKATKQVGSGKSAKEEYVFKTFDEFFDYEKAIENIEPKQEKEEMDEGMKKIIYGG